MPKAKRSCRRRGGGGNEGLRGGTPGGNEGLRGGGGNEGRLRWGRARQHRLQREGRRPRRQGRRPPRLQGLQRQPSRGLPCLRQPPDRGGKLELRGGGGGGRGHGVERRAFGEQKAPSAPVARRGQRDELGRTGRRGSWRAGARGEARLALREERGPLHRREGALPLGSSYRRRQDHPQSLEPLAVRAEVRGQRGRRVLEAEVPVTGGRRGGRDGPAGRRAGARRRGGARELRPLPRLPNTFAPSTS